MLTHIVGWVAVATTMAVLTSVGTGGSVSPERLRKSASEVLTPQPLMQEMVVGSQGRKPSEDLARIREVLSPAVSNLATAFGVTRQSIYNWLNGDPVADENAAKLRDLAQAADIFAHEGIVVNAELLKRKFADGKTLLQVVQAGESARDAALMFVQIYKREAAQRERMNVRFANRAKTPATADFDLPMHNDHD